MRQVRLIILAMAMLLNAVPGFSIEFEHEGTIDLLDIERGASAVGDLYLILPSDVRVYTKNGAPLSVQSLREGMTVGVASMKEGDPPSVTDIVVLPAN